MLILVAQLAGCGGSSGSSNLAGGGGGGSNQAPTPTPTPTPAPTPPPGFTVPGFGITQVASLILRHVPANETGSSQVVSGTASNRALQSARKVRLDRHAASDCPSKDMPCELRRAEDAQIEQVMARGPATTEPISKRFSALPEGATTSFFISTGNQNVTCQKMNSEAETLHCTILAQVVNNQPVVSKTTALSIARAFDSNNPFLSGTGIYDQVRGVFGSEWLQNPSGGRDGDLKVAIVLVNSSALGNPNLFGFFRPADEFAQTDIASSNQGEIVYLNSDKATGDLFEVLSTLAHEFQHLVDFNVKFGRNGGFNGENENVTINEGKSVLAEDLSGYSLTAQGGGNQFLFVTCDAFLRNTSIYPFFVFGSANADYGKGYLLLRYIHDRFGVGAVSRIATSTGVGKSNIEQQLGISFQLLFDDWSAANLSSAMANAPFNFRYANGFTTSGTFTVRQLGTRTLPGVIPQTVSNPPAGSVTQALDPWAAYYIEYSNGSGQDLGITLVQNLNTDAGLVVQSPRGTFSQNQ